MYPHAIVAAATREGATQHATDMRTLSKGLGWRISLVHGKQGINFAQLVQGPDILVGTVGKLMDFMLNQ